MFEDIKNKKVLITGASGGIGSCMAKLFASHGSVVGLHYNNNKKEAIKLLNEIRKEGGKAEAFKADLLDVKNCKNMVRSFIKKFNGIDILVNNAGAVFEYKHFSELDEESWDNTFKLNVKAPYYISGEAFTHMKDHGGGKIINISSATVKYGCSPRSMHYSAA